MNHYDRIKAILLQAQTPQEFLVQLEKAADHSDDSDRNMLLMVRDALGEVLNKSTVTWLPIRQEIMDDRQ